MNGWMDVTFQRAWFGGPFMARTQPLRPVRSGPPVARNEGPFDGPLTESMHAQWFAQRPLVHPAQQLQTLEGAGYPVTNLGAVPVFCPPGQVPAPTGFPGKSQCVPFSPPSGMIGPKGGVGELVPPTYPASRTFPVRPFWGWQQA